MRRRAFWTCLSVGLTAGLPQAAPAQIVVAPDYQVSTFASGIQAPEGLAIDAAGNLYVAATGADEVVKVTPDGTASSFASSCAHPLAFMATYPTKMAFGQDGFLYVGAVGAYNNPCNPYGDLYDSLLRISPTGEVSLAAGGDWRPYSFNDISGVATAPDGRIFFTDTWGSRSIYVYSPADGTVATWAVYPWPWGTAEPYAAIFDASGNLIVSFAQWYSPGAVQRFAPDGTVSTILEGFSANAIRFDAHGTLWLADSGNVYQLAPDGSLTTFASGFQGARDLIFDAQGNLYVSESATNSVVKISPAALPVAIDVKPGSYPNSINLGSNGDVPVAILSSPTFDARTVDPATVTLASAPVALRGQGGLMYSFEDVNGDGLPDLVVHLATQALELSSVDTAAVLEGRTFGGQLIRGSDSVRVVPLQ